MKRIFTIALLLLAASSIIFGQGDQKSKGKKNVEETLKQMELDWANAVKNGDTATLNRVLADDWVTTLDNGERHTKSELFVLVKSGKYIISSITTDPMTVRVYGNTAVVIGGDIETSTSEGKDSSGHYTWTDVFVKQKDGSWKAVVSHNSKITASP